MNRSMDIKATEGHLYSALPKCVKDDKTQLGFTEVKPPQDASFLTSFLKRHVPKKRHHELEDEHGHAYKKVALENTKKNKINDFVRTPGKRKKLTSREKRDLKLLEIKPEEQRYEMYVPLHELWKDYMRDLMNFEKITQSNHGEAERKLLKADYHGAIITAAKSKCTSVIGLTGIVLIETKHTFKIITEENKLKTIPKKNTEFTITLEGYLFTIYGNNFMYKSADRSSRKFRGTSIKFT